MKGGGLVLDCSEIYEIIEFSNYDDSPELKVNAYLKTGWVMLAFVKKMI
jgi:hypothetical protein